MTDDIVARLRDMGFDITGEAADEIERLRAELAAEREQFHDAVLGHSAETLKLTAERDALRALLREARESIYDTGLQEELVASIAAALKGDGEG